MVFIVIEAWYPAKISRLVAQKYFEVAQKYPHDKSLGKMVFGPIFQPTKDGWHVIKGWECKDDKIKDSLIELGKHELMYAETEGFQFSIDTYVDITEGASIIGVKMPQ
jgi:hypothetical protein